MQADWQKSFEAGEKLRARILYVDAASKRVCLTLLPHLVSGQSAPSLPKGNTLFQACTWPMQMHVKTVCQGTVKASAFMLTANVHAL